MNFRKPNRKTKQINKCTESTKQIDTAALKRLKCAVENDMRLHN